MKKLILILSSLLLAWAVNANAQSFKSDTTVTTRVANNDTVTQVVINIYTTSTTSTKEIGIIDSIKSLEFPDHIYKDSTGKEFIMIFVQWYELFYDPNDDAFFSYLLPTNHPKMPSGDILKEEPISVIDEEKGILIQLYPNDNIVVLTSLEMQKLKQRQTF